MAGVSCSFWETDENRERDRANRLKRMNGD